MIQHPVPIAGFILLLTTATTSAEIIPFDATYELSKYEIKLGIAEIKLDSNSGEYTYEKLTQPKGLFKMILKDDNAYEKSVFKINNKNTIISKEYLYELKRRGKLKREHYFFNKNATVDIQHRGQNNQLKIPTGTLDRSSMEIALMLNAKAGKDQSYNVVDKGKLKQYQFSYQGKKTLDTDSGKYECDEYKVIRSTGNRSTTMCLAESLNYLPVFMEHDEKGTTIQMQLIKVQFPGKKISRHTVKSEINTSGEK